MSTIKLRPVPWSLLVPVTFNSAPVLMERVPFLRSRTFVALTDGTGVDLNGLLAQLLDMLRVPMVACELVRVKPPMQ